VQLDFGTAPTAADADTLTDLSSADSPSATSAADPRGSAVRTVLPRVDARDDGLELVFEGRLRYEGDQLLGEGGMGEVRLAHDNDIDRRVALKRAHPGMSRQALARFAEEVRTVGKLEHPNIVPIHDVGLDEEGRYFFVMKYVEGETLETVIERLAAGDREAHERFDFDARVHVFLGLLRALAHAHERGFLHRDLKPANVMIGRLGEVVLMDWGIAKPIGGAELPADDDAYQRRLVHTQHGAIVGTPSYMSPEQARGAPDLDVRSDLYAACVVFHELMTLRHYLADRPQNVPGQLSGAMEAPLPPVTDMPAWTHASQGPLPIEYVHFLRRGMQKDRDARWGSAEEMIHELEAALAGRVRVQCPMSLTKRVTREAGRFVDRHPRLATTLLFATPLTLAATLLTLASF